MLESEKDLEQTLISNLVDWVKACSIKNTEELLVSLSNALANNNPFEIKNRTRELLELILKSMHFAIKRNVDAIPKIVRGIIEIIHLNSITISVNQRTFREAFELIEFQFLQLTEFEIIGIQLPLIELSVFFENDWVYSYMLGLLTNDKYHDLIKEASTYCLEQKCRSNPNKSKEISKFLVKNVDFKNLKDCNDNKEEYIKNISQNCRIFKLLGDLAVKEIIPDLGLVVTRKKSELEHYWLSDSIARIMLPPVKKKPTKPIFKRFVKSIPTQIVIYILIALGIVFVKLYDFDLFVYSEYFDSNTLLLVIVCLLSFWQIIVARGVLNSIASATRHLGRGISITSPPIINQFVRIIKRLPISDKTKSDLQFWTKGDLGRRIFKSLIRTFIFIIVIFILITLSRFIYQIILINQNVNFQSLWNFEIDDIPSLTIFGTFLWILNIVKLLFGNIEGMLNIPYFFSLRNYPLHGRKPYKSKKRHVSALISTAIITSLIVFISIISNQLYIYNIKVSNITQIVYFIATLFFALIYINPLKWMKTKIPYEIYEKSVNCKVEDNVKKRHKITMKIHITGTFSQRFGFSWIPLYISFEPQIYAGRCVELDLVNHRFETVTNSAEMKVGLPRNQGKLLGILRMHKIAESIPPLIRRINFLRKRYEVETRPIAEIEFNQSFNNKEKLPEKVFITASSYNADTKLITSMIIKEKRQVVFTSELKNDHLYIGNWWYTNEKSLNEIHEEFVFNVKRTRIIS